MQKVIRNITAGVLAAALLLSCGCGASEPESSPEKETPTSHVTDSTAPDITESAAPETTEPSVTTDFPIEEPTVPTSTEPTVPAFTEPTAPMYTEPMYTEPVITQPMPPQETGNRNVTPVYPQSLKCPREEDYQDFWDHQTALNQWTYERMNAQPDAPENAHDLDPFLSAAMKQFLSGTDTQVCSPMNIYFALAMLAETADGSSRQQILDALGHRDMGSLRQQAQQLWQALYCDDGQTMCLLANSVWLDQEYSFRQDVLSRLGENYYAWAFVGDLGSPETDRQLAQWLNSQTGNLLTEYTNGIRLNPATVFTLVSTAYFCTGWKSEFRTDATKPKVFHARNRDITADFMHKTMMKKTYYWRDNFTAISLPLAGDHQMWLILPDEGYSPQDLLNGAEYYDLISNPDSQTPRKSLTVNLSMPKFDVSSDRDLVPGLQAMGIKDVFNPRKSNFRSMTDAPVYVDNIQHAARVAVDEEGVIAAAYTLIPPATSAPPQEAQEIDFVLDRPFLFAITGRDCLPLFAGVVAEP